MKIGLAAAVIFLATHAPAQRLPFWTMPASAEALTQEVDRHLADARGAREKLLQVAGVHTVNNTLVPYDEILRHLMLARSPAGVLSDTHPDPAFRKAAQAAVRKVSAATTDLALNSGVYRALDAIDKKTVGTQESYYVSKELKKFRLMGASLPEVKRLEIARLRAELVQNEQEFSQNIVEGLASLKIAAADLDGVPSDFLRQHKADAAGKISITNDRADAEVVEAFSSNEASRRAAYVHFRNRGYPGNMATLDRLIALRNQIAKESGYPSFAALQMEERMVGSVENLRRFLADLDRASAGATARERALLLAAKKKDQADAVSLDPWDYSYYSRLVRMQKYDFDEREARPYFPFAAVQQGILDTAARLFGLRFQRVMDAAVWHPSVTCWNVYSGDELLGRVYLDLHPRPGKFQHFRSSSLRSGIKGYSLTEGVLTCNFAEPKGGDPALMSPRMAATFFHEFGHLVHGLVAGRKQWEGLGRPEPDFMEAPSQMLEEWMSDPNVLASFARHYETDKPIPADLVARMVKAGEFGKGVTARRGLMLSAVALEYHDGKEKVDTDAVWNAMNRKYGFETSAPEMHSQASWSHLGTPGYSAAYYVYSWSQAIAKDLRTGFDSKDLMAPGPARRYRDLVLAPGGSKPAADLIADFLGRPFSLKSFETWLNAE